MPNLRISTAIKPQHDDSLNPGSPVVNLEADTQVRVYRPIPADAIAEIVRTILLHWKTDGQRARLDQILLLPFTT